MAKTQKQKPDQPDEIKTVEQLERAYPQLVQEIRKQAKKMQQPSLDLTKGFLLALDDPFAAGTLRTFASLKKKSLQLPFVLPFKDKDTPRALKGYIIRAEGGGDFDRAKVARKALEKCQ